MVPSRLTVDTPEIRPGTIIADRYRVDRLVGRGGMAEVWAANHVVTGRPFALKFLIDASKTSVRRRFIREAKAMTAFDHPNVVRVFDVAVLEDGRPFMVMELLAGETLATLLKRKRRLSMSETALLLLPVVSAVGTAHAAGVVHRDLKPGNVFLEAVPGGPSPRVLDFGIAKLIDFAHDEESLALTSTGDLLGTPHYMAPEQVFGERDLDHLADIWAIGVILHQCLSGSRPFRGNNPGQIIKSILSAQPERLDKLRKDVPEEVASLVVQMLTRDRAQRLDDLAEVVRVVGKFAPIRVPGFDPPRLRTKDDDSGDTSGATGGSIEVVGIRMSDRPPVGDASTVTDGDRDGIEVAVDQPTPGTAPGRVEAIDRPGGASAFPAGRGATRVVGFAGLLLAVALSAGVASWIAVSRSPTASTGSPAAFVSVPSVPVESPIESGGMFAASDLASASPSRVPGSTSGTASSARETRAPGPAGLGASGARAYPPAATPPARLPGGVYGKTPF